jgi:hypothetical protein
MPNQQLLDYIKQQLRAGSSAEQIKQDLLSSGWQEANVNEALSVLSPQPVQNENPASQIPSPSRPIAPADTNSKIPLPVRIIALLMLLGGLLSLFASVYEIFENLTNPSPLILPLSVSIPNILLAGIIIVVAFGLSNMRKWALYFMVVSAGLSILSFLFGIIFLHSALSLYWIIITVLDIVFAAYLIFIGDKFEPGKPDRPLLIIGAAILALFFTVGAYFTSTHSQQAQQQAENSYYKDSGWTEYDTIKLMDAAKSYHNLQNTYKGFKTPADFKPDSTCGNRPIVNISSDGSQMAVFIQYCSSDKQGKYACQDSKLNEADVDATYAQSGATSCQTQTQNSEEKNAANNDDLDVKLNLMQMQTEIETYFDKNNGSYKNFVPIETNADIPSCSEKAIVKISPDGQSYALFQKLCSKQNVYLCADLNAKFVEVNEEYAKDDRFSCE